MISNWQYLGETPTNPPLYRFKCVKCKCVISLPSKDDIQNFRYCHYCGTPMNRYTDEDTESYESWVREE